FSWIYFCFHYQFRDFFYHILEKYLIYVSNIKILLTLIKILSELSVNEFNVYSTFSTNSLFLLKNSLFFSFNFFISSLISLTSSIIMSIFFSTAFNRSNIPL